MISRECLHHEQKRLYLFTIIVELCFLKNWKKFMDHFSALVLRGLYYWVARGCPGLV